MNDRERLRAIHWIVWISWIAQLLFMLGAMLLMATAPAHADGVAALADGQKGEPA